MDTPKENKLSANEAIVNMLSCINVGRNDDFYNYAIKYRDTLSKNGDWYFRIKRLIDSRPQIKELKSLNQTVKGLLIQREVEESIVYIPDNISSFISEFMVEWDNKELYRNHNLPLQNKVLLHGATGNGKTTIARHIAKLVGLPFVEINSDSIIDSHIGSTSTNIHNLFKDISEPCVFFWDEIDTIGRKRGTDLKTAAAQENDRMVNSMLVNIEKMNKDVIFLGATNRMDILDSAFLRRFDTIIEIEPPTIEQKNVFFTKLSEHYRLCPKYIDLEKYVSYSDIKREFVRQSRNMVREIILQKTELF